MAVDSSFFLGNSSVELEQVSRKDQANGYAGLDGSGLIDPSELPFGAGVESLAKSGGTQLTGDVTLSEGTDIGLTQAGNDIEIAYTGSGGGGALGGAAVYRTTATPNIATGTVTAITFDNEEFDDSAYHDNSTNPSRLTIPATGVYVVTGSVMWDSNTTGQRGLWVQLNGTDTATNRKGGQYRGGLAGSDMEDLSLILALSSGDFIELMAFQTSGANRTIVVTASRPRFAIYRLA